MRVIVTPARQSGRAGTQRSGVTPLGKLNHLLSSPYGQAGREILSAEDLLRLGLTREEIADLEFREPFASEISEYMRRYGGGLQGLVDAANTVIRWHIQDIDREIDMLVLRRRLLLRKTRALGRLLDATSQSAEPRQAI